MTLRPFSLLALALVLHGTTLRAQEPSGNEEPRYDPEVVPAQFQRNALPVGIAQPLAPSLPLSSSSGNVTAESIIAAVVDPATPLVRIHLRVPPHVAPGKDIPYKLFVDNPTGGAAHKVVVRVPMPKGVTLGECSPTPRQGADGNLVWEIGTLEPGDRRTLDIALKPNAQIAEVAVKAYVTFEHGQVVVTKIDRPKVEVVKRAPKQAIGTEAIPVAVEVTNTGKVPVHNLELVEDVSAGFEFAPDGSAEEGATRQQRIWKLGTLRAGERRRVDYRLTTKGAGELMAQSAVRSPDMPDALLEKASTKVLMPAIDLKLLGPAKVAPAEPADYTAVVTNSGTVPLPEVLLTILLPEDVSVSKMTNGGQRTADRITWRGPFDRNKGPLQPGEKLEVRFRLKATQGGQRVITAEVESSRNLTQSRDVTTQFEGTALLRWRAELDPPTVAAGQEGTLTVQVQNNGTDDARGTRLSLEIPQGIRIVQATPLQYQASAGMLNFNQVTIPAGGSRVYTMKYQPTAAGTNWFKLQLAADVLGNQPMTKEQELQVTNGRTTSRNRDRD